LNRLVRESVSGFYLRKIKFPDSDRPFAPLDPVTMPWSELQGLLLAHLRHRYTDYEAALAAGGDRDALHHEIHFTIFKQFPFLRSDPRPFPPDPPRLALDEIAAHLAQLKDLEHGLLEALATPATAREARPAIRGMLAELRVDISEATTILTKQRVTEDGVIMSYRATATGADYDFLGHHLHSNHLAYAGFRCPGCGEGIYRSKRPVPIGQGQRAVVHSCLCVTHFTPDSRQRIAPLTLEKWGEYVTVLASDLPTSVNR
jgi:predicted RNA-binding Zn-ribbon protein involved in translation (DUF1610 family)